MSTVLWGLVGIAGLAVLVLVVKGFDSLLLRAEERGWIYYRKKSGGGIVSAGVAAAMTELDRVTRPSAEHRIKAEDPIVEDDRKGGD